MSAEPQRAPIAPSQELAPSQKQPDEKLARFPPAKEEVPAPRRSRRRIALILALPLALAAVGGYFWLTGGRYVSTDNAYVQQDKVTIVPEVAGRIVEVGAVENQHVEKGDLLFRIDDAQYVVAVQQEEAAVASARVEVERLKAAYAKAISDQDAARQALTFAQDTFDRQNELAKSGVVAKSALDKARLDLQQAEAVSHSADQAVLSAKAALAGNPTIATDEHPEVLEALSKLAKAKLDLAHTTVTAPAAGTVSQTDRLHPGEYVTSGTSVLSLVETGNSWVEANFKETQLAHLQAGQLVTIDVDSFPGETFQGRVESLGAGTGAEFSLLPAQNATGNWVKVVQRIPVRIALTDANGMPPLRTGMSASVTVDTGRATRLGLALGELGANTSARAEPIATQPAAASTE